MIRNYFITAIRNLWRNKFFSLINILGLSVAIACCMLIFLYAKDEVSFDRFHEKRDQIYRITADNISKNGKDTQKWGSTGMMPGPEFKAQIPEVEAFLRIQSTTFNIKKGTEVIEQDALYADDNFFSVFSFPLAYGDPKTALKELHSIVISEQVAEKYFGKTNVVGKTLELSIGNKFEPFVVSAVAKNSPQNSSIKINVLVPMKFNQTLDDDKQWMNFFLNTFVVLKPGTDIKSTERSFNRIYATAAYSQIKEMREKYDFTNHIKYGLQPLAELHLSTDYVADNGLTNASNPIYSYILIGITIFILLIACINFINLTISQSLKRAKEIGIRKVIGGQRKQLIFQFLGESFVISFLAFILAIAITLVTLPFFNELSNKALAFSYLLDSKLISGYILLFLVTGLLAGFYPALVLSGLNPVETLYGKLRFSGKNYLSKGLIIFQFTLSTFLIISTLIIYSQFNYLVHYDLGYDVTNVMRVNTTSLSDEKLSILKNELRKDPSIQLIAAQQAGRHTTMAHINGETNQDFDQRYIDENYFSLFQIPIVKGRNFSRVISSDSSQGVIINECFAKEAGWKDPIGKVVDFFYHNKKFTVIGVVRDYHFAALTEKIKPQLFTMNPRYRYGSVYVKISPGNKVQAMNYIEKTCKKLYPMYPYQYTFEDEALKKEYDSEAKWKQIISFSAILTIFISCIGLFGLAALSSEKRAKEIGIRKVLGASVNTLVKNLTTEFLKLVLLASCIAVPIAWWIMTKWLDNYPYRIEIKAYMFVGAIIGVLSVTLCTVSYQAIKASLANPVKNLRTE